MVGNHKCIFNARQCPPKSWRILNVLIHVSVELTLQSIGHVVSKRHNAQVHVNGLDIVVMGNLLAYWRTQMHTGKETP